MGFVPDAPAVAKTGFVPDADLTEDALPPEALGDSIPDPAGVPGGAPFYDPDVERAKKSIWGEKPRTPWMMLGKSLVPNLTLDDLKAGASATVRPAVKAVASLPLMPLDAGVGIANFLKQGDYSREAFLRGMNPFARGSPEDYATPSQRLEQTLDQYTRAPTTTGGRVAEAISSGVLGARLPGLPQPAPRAAVNPTRADLAIEAGRRHDVPVYFDDVTGNPILKKLGVAAENVPVVGTAAGRATQAEKAKQAAQKLTGRFAAEVADEVPVAMQGSMQRRLAAFRGAADKLYTRAAAMLDPAGDVPSSRFDSAIHHELARQEALGTAANPQVVEILSKFDHAPRGNFSLMRELRSQLKEQIADFYRGGKNAAIGDKGVNRLVEMRKALEADMGDFARKVGGAAEKAWRDADGFYKTNLVPFKEQGFAKLVKTGEPEKAWQYLTAQGGVPTRAARMYNGLDTQGRAAVRAGMLQTAMANAVGPKGNFSPAKFAKYMEDHETVVNQFFHGNELQEIRGFQNLMRHVERAGQYMENPPTGQRLTTGLMLGSLPLSWKPAAVAAGAAGTVRALFQTQAGRDLLIAASKLKPGSPAMGTVTDQLRVIMTRSAAAAPAEMEKERLQLNPVGEVTGEPAQ